MHRAVCYLPHRKVLRGGNGCAQRGSALRGVRTGPCMPAGRFLKSNLPQALVEYAQGNRIY